MKTACQIVTITNQKGGTGKTTTAAALAQAAFANNKRVLAIDLDSQANLSYVLGADNAGPGSYELLNGEFPSNVIQKTEQGIDVISGSLNLAAIKTTTGSARRLEHALTNIKKDYSWIFIDVPPLMGETTYNALQASTGIIIPMETDASSLQGLVYIMGIARRIQDTNPALNVLGCILTRYDERTKVNRFYKDAINKEAHKQGTELIKVIRSGIPIREAQAMKESLFTYAPRSKPALDYMDLFKIIKKKTRV